MVGLVRLAADRPRLRQASLATDPALGGGRGAPDVELSARLETVLVFVLLVGAVLILLGADEMTVSVIPEIVLVTLCAVALVVLLTI